MKPKSPQNERFQHTSLLFGPKKLTLIWQCRTQGNLWKSSQSMVYTIAKQIKTSAVQPYKTRLHTWSHKLHMISPRLEIIRPRLHIISPGFTLWGQQIPPSFSKMYRKSSIFTKTFVFFLHFSLLLLCIPAVYKCHRGEWFFKHHSVCFSQVSLSLALPHKRDEKLCRKSTYYLKCLFF